MRAFFLILISSVLSVPMYAQQLPQGLWNAGRAFALQSPQEDKLILTNHLTAVQLYPGFAVVKSDYLFQSTEMDTTHVEFYWKDTSTTLHPYFVRLHNLPSSGLTILVGKDSLPLIDQQFTIQIPPKQTIQITTYQICPTNQAKLSREGGIREHNALIISNGHWKHNINRQVLVDLKGGLTQLDLTGVYPNTVMGNRTRLRWLNNQSDSSVVLWYAGAAPDYTFEKKVVPQKHLLFDDINTFNTWVFAEESFSAVSLTDFSTNAEKSWMSVLYFILFSIPWIMLVVFIIYLVKKPKK